MDRHLAYARMRSQGLAEPLGGVTDVVSHLVGLQAQDDWVAAYAVRPRTGDAVTADDVTRASDLICTWAMRGTLHLVAARDARWLVELLGPRFLAAARGRRHQLGLTDDLLSRSLPIVRDSLPGTRSELAAAVRANGIDLAPGQAEAHLVAAAALSGLLHRCGRVYEALPAQGERPAEPLAELAKRYLAGHAPATPEDFAAWSGLSLTQARQAFRDLPQPSIVEDEVTGVRLLGHFDPILLGYRDRSFVLDPKHAKHVQRGGGFLQPIVVAGGRVVGTWSRQVKGKRLEIAVHSFGTKIKGVEKEIADLERFFDRG